MYPGDGGTTNFLWRRSSQVAKSGNHVVSCSYHARSCMDETSFTSNQLINIALLFVLCFEMFTIRNHPHVSRAGRTRTIALDIVDKTQIKSCFEQTFF